jgi:chromosome segregation protein
LTKLELHGFKSFADSTELVFEPGVSAIVGPNGCGKSNVSDAVRWVLGEQRARLLRGSKMEEVIFQGSSARRPVSLAEVSLHFDNDDGQLPVPFREVVITRRLSRSGESEYFINRAPARLRDIGDMLRGTGLGGDTGVVIEAKMIDALLSDRPDDRRELFEEAAGVGLYRDRRRTTERRLEETSQDLQRLDDLIAEVQTQVRSLARQRRRAERSAELMQRRFTVDLSLAAREMEAWRDELQRLEAQLTDSRALLPELEQSVEDAERGRDDAHGHRTAAEAQRTELLRLVTSQREQALQLRGEMAVAEERQRNSLARRQRAEAEASEGEAYGQRLVDDRERAKAARLQCEHELSAAGEELARSQEAEDVARGNVARTRSAVEQAEQRVRESQDQARRLDIDRERARRELDEVAQRAEVLETERAQLTDSVALVRRERESAAVALEEATSRAVAARADVDAARAADRETRDNEAAARAELFRADEAFTGLQGKVNALEALERERVGLAPAAARLLRERERFGEGAILGPLSDFLSTDQSSALLVERFLGATVHAVVVRDREAADAIRAWHVSANPGPLLLLPIDAMSEEQAGEAEPDSLYPLVEAAAAARPWVRTLLGHVRAEERGTAFVDARGAVWLPGASGGPGPLRRRAELFALREELTRSEIARQEAITAADAQRAALQRAEQRLAGSTEAADQAQLEVRRSTEHQAELDRRLQRAERELRDAEALAARLAARRDELAARLALLDADAAAIAEVVADRESLVASERMALANVERAQEEARERRTQCQVEEAQAQARLQMSSDRERRLVQELQSASSRLDALRAELSDLANADSALAEQMAHWQLDAESRDATLADGESRLRDAEVALSVADDALQDAEHTLDDIRHRATATSEEVHRAEMRFADLSSRRRSIRERLEAEWRRPLEEMLASVPPVEMDDDTLRAESAALREQLEALGPVNVLAIEEHEETVKRFEFLTTQRADLAEARQSLQQAIREIDATARELFLATFTQVRENFRQIFLTLFGGGECDLRLENPETPLDCDIEIHASPRGKRTQRIHLLSSGERALVALSLLFGIFLTKPSPFCLLDEVDAPLDDANVGRFVRMLNQFKMRTQFIVITHNPRTTTEAADAVYGVTMQEPGVSTIVSVRMRGAVIDDLFGADTIGAVSAPA